ncbi:hypothetical protein [Streptomyces sp. CA-132043]|uniref:hypothetical protein n=1 Tax=Streptomyces sp. CA-132043 TaxID=3240048 RepID=UPI003D9044BC
MSQPGVVGYDEPDPDDPTQVKGKPGMQMMPAGEFIIGYDRIDAKPARASYPEDKIPAWMHDGSFHVVRRLAQDVPGWWNQVEQALQQLKAKGAVPEDTTVDWLAARMVGRWKNGTSLIKCPMAEPSDGRQPDNEFDFADDLDGLVTPLFSHTRKSAPRAGLVNDGKKVPEILNRRRRIIRRGSPYGKPIATDGSPGGRPGDERGMAFSCYQADIVGQFEFTQIRWINNDDNPQGRTPPAGPDAMISGMLTAVSDGNIGFEGKNKEGARTSTQVCLNPFVTTEGTAYAFAPSLDTLRRLTDGRLEGEVPDIPTHDPHGAHIDAMLPSSSHPGRYWSFQGRTVRPATETKGSETTDLLAGPSHSIASWPALHDMDRVDAVLPIHDEPGQYWVFFTGEDGAQHYRYLGVEDTGADTPDSRHTGADANPVSTWGSLADVTHVDAFAPVPDAQPDAAGNHRYWVFHTTSAGQRYRTISIRPAPHGDTKVFDDGPISAWPSLAGVETVDEIVPVPGKQRENGESWFWVFHRDGYRIIGVADGAHHADRVVQQDRPLGEWNSPPERIARRTHAAAWSRTAA